VFTGVETTHAESLPSKQVISTIPRSPVVVHVFFQGNEGHVYLVRNNDDKEAKPPFGIMEQFTVRTLAFGMVPAEVTLQIRQVVYGTDVPPDRPGLRGYVEPWVLSDLDTQPRVSGRVVVRVVQMTLDGRPVAVGSSCESVHPGGVDLNVDGDYSPLTGGSFKGTVDIPRFSRCEGMGELLTAAISGPDNPLEIKQERVQL
jgi:hypothetical protein